MPRYLEPMKATLATKPFRDEEWLFEVKWDGYRVEAVVRDGKVELFTRNGHDAETYFPRLLTPPTWIDAREAIVDGEVVALDERGRPDFSLLQERISWAAPAARCPLVFQAFDLLYLDGRSLLDVPLEQRKRLLELVVRPSVAASSSPSPSTPRGSPSSRRPRRRSSRGSSPSTAGRATSPAAGARVAQDQGAAGAGAGGRRLDAGGGDREGPRGGRRRRLRGRAAAVRGQGGLGVHGRTRKELRARLGALETDRPPFDPAPPPDYRGRWGGDLAGVRWTRPELVIRAEIGGWTRDGHVRQTAFKGIEAGRDPREVVRERAIDPAQAEREAEASDGRAEPVRPTCRVRILGPDAGVDTATEARPPPASAARGDRVARDRRGARGAGRPQG